MKVLVVSGSYPPIQCGVGDYLEQLVGVLGQSCNIVVLTTVGATKTPQTLPVIRGWSARHLPQILRAICQQKPDIIHIQYHTRPYGRKLTINLLPLIVKLLFKARLIVTLHEFHDASTLGKVRAFITGLPAKIVIVTNKESFASLSRWRSAQTMLLIPVGNNIPVVQTDPRSLQALRDRYHLTSKKTGVYFGFIDPSKGVSRLLDSITSWPMESQLVLAAAHDATNPYHQEIKHQVEGSQGRVVWTDFLPAGEISALLQLADFAVFPFDSPTSLRRSSLVVSLAHGLPTIVSGPVLEPLRDGLNCLTIPDNDSTSIAKAVNRLCSDDKFSKLLRGGSLELAKQFDWKNIAEAHYKLYSKINS